MMSLSGLALIRFVTILKKCYIYIEEEQGFEMKGEELKNENP
jgi:hypothetical protein